MTRQTVAIDFDGCIHAYTSQWEGPNHVPDPPVPGALEFIEQTLQTHDVVIYSVRANTFGGRMAIVMWLRAQGLREELLTQLRITSDKPSAVIYIDDRAWRFEGTWPTPEEIASFRPWNKPLAVGPE